MERDTGIEPVPSPWKGVILPLYRSRILIRIVSSMIPEVDGTVKTLSEIEAMTQGVEGL